MNEMIVNATQLTVKIIKHDRECNCHIYSRGCHCECE